MGMSIISSDHIAENGNRKRERKKEKEKKYKNAGSYGIVVLGMQSYAFVSCTCIGKLVDASIRDKIEFTRSRIHSSLPSTKTIRSILSSL